MNLKEELQQLITSQKACQKMRLEGIEYKNSEALKYLRLRNRCVERRTELEQEVEENSEHIKQLEVILTRLT